MAGGLAGIMVLMLGYDTETYRDSIRDVIAFPKAASGHDPLTGAPTPITAAQRKEAGIDATPAAQPAP